MTPQLRRTELARLARLADPVGVFLFPNAIQNSKAANGRCRRITYLGSSFEKATMAHGSPWLVSALAAWLIGSLVL